MVGRSMEIDSNFFTPRSYQQELVDRAKEQNIIVPLGTGTGKTFIAVMLIKEMSPPLRHSLENGGKKSIFIVDKVALVDQQAEQIRAQTDLKVAEYHGQRNCDLWNEDRWTNEINDNQVLVMTAMIFVQLLTHGFITYGQVNLMVIDECHHAAAGNHPYRQVMDKYKEYLSEQPNPEEIPRILGLTASVVSSNSDPSQLQRQINLLEDLLCSSIETASDLLTLSKYGAKPKILVVGSHNYDALTNPMCAKARKVLDNGLEFCRKATFHPDLDIDPTKPFHESLSKVKSILNTLGPWAAWRVCKLKERELQLLNAYTMTELQQMFISMAQTYIRAVKHILAEVETVKTVDELKRYLPDKVVKLLMVLRASNPAFRNSSNNNNNKQQSNSKSENPNEGSSSSKPSSSTTKPTASDKQITAASAASLSSLSPPLATASSSSAVVPTNNNNTRTEGGGTNNGTQKSSNGNNGPPLKSRKHYYRSNHYHRKNYPSLDFSGIIFVEQRYVAYIMKTLINCVKRWDPESYDYLRADFVIGVSGYNVTTEDKLALHRRQEMVLREFRSKRLNLMIATSVLEEGVDIRHCNAVIRFDHPKDFRSYVQSKGRARKQGARFYVLVEEKDKFEQIRKLKQYGQIEMILQQHSRNRDNPPAIEINPIEADQLLPPYVVYNEKTSASAKVSMSTAIALINRYCAKLPSDIFTRLTPQCTISLWTLDPLTNESVRIQTEQEVSGILLYKAHLVLPINSPVKQIIDSPLPMRNKKLAQMAVALEVCKILHQQGELDDHLLPKGKESVTRLLNELEDDGEVWPLDGRARPGSTKRKQYYDRKTAESLTGSLPLTGEECYIHAILMNLEKPVEGPANPKKRKIVDPASSAKTLAILSKKPLPKLPKFPLFARQGKISASFSTLESKLILTEEQFKMIAQFHQFIFADILRLEKFSMKYDPGNVQLENNGVFIVPLLKIDANMTVLDWKFVKTVVSQMDSIPRHPLDCEREKFQFEPKKYEDGIVMPWYRNKESPYCYHVADLCYDLSPKDPFPDNEFKSFNEYFMQKYGLEIYNQEQPLLDVDYTSSRLNLLLPRFLNRRGYQLKTSQNNLNNQRQLLVPELVEIHPVPASLWNQIVLLPSVLYRLNYLLLADEFRTEVEREAFTDRPGIIQEDSDFEWETLDYGWSDGLENEILTGKSDWRKSGLGTVTNSSFNSSTGGPVGSLTPSSAAAQQSNRGRTDGAKETGKVGEGCGGGGGEDEEDFDIGVWDPTLAEGLTWHVDPPASLLSNSTGVPIVGASSWMGGGNGGSVAGELVPPGGGDHLPSSFGDDLLMGDEDEEDEEMDGNGDPLFNYEFKNHIMNLDKKPPGLARLEQENQERVTNGGDGKASSAAATSADPTKSSILGLTADMFQPSSDIEPSGWDVTDEELLAGSTGAPLKINRPNGGSTAGFSLNGVGVSGPNGGTAAAASAPGSSAHLGLTILSMPDNIIDKTALARDIAGEEFNRKQHALNQLASQQGAAASGNGKKNTAADIFKSERQRELDSIEFDTEIKTQEPSIGDLLAWIGENGVGGFSSNSDPFPPLEPIPCSSHSDRTVSVICAAEDEWLTLPTESPVLPTNEEYQEMEVAISKSTESKTPLRLTPTSCSSKIKRGIVYQLKDSITGIEKPNVKNVLLEGQSCPQPKNSSSGDDLWKEFQKKVAVKGSDDDPVDFEKFSFESNEGMNVNKYGPSPCLILQAITMSAANDGINLERLETVGDSFLKYATTVYLFSTAEGQSMHEGKLSFMRSKQVSNYYLYRLGKRKKLGELMIGSKFEPQDNWLPPVYLTIDPKAENEHVEVEDLKMEKALEGEEEPVKEETKEKTGWDDPIDGCSSNNNGTNQNKTRGNNNRRRGGRNYSPSSTSSNLNTTATDLDGTVDDDAIEVVDLQRPPPSSSSDLLLRYNILNQQSIADKSIADGVEALIGTYLLTYGPQGALRFMQWLGLKVKFEMNEMPDPLLHFIEEPEAQLNSILERFNLLHVEQIIGYTFKRKAYLVQAFTHASYYQNNHVTDCYQRLEFLGDAVLDYMITRYLFEDKKQHNPGVLTDLRSALVNNTIFASLAVKYEFHKYFMSSSPGLHHVITKFVRLYKEKKKEANFDEELYSLNVDDEVEDEEDIEVPKSLGDIFESVAGAIYLDSGGSLDAVWSVYYRLMKDQLEKCCSNPPKSPIRELLELQPESTKFSKLERLVKEGKVRVTVDVGGERYTGMGRSYKIAKSTAAKRALRAIKQAAKQKPNKL